MAQQVGQITDQQVAIRYSVQSPAQEAVAAAHFKITVSLVVLVVAADQTILRVREEQAALEIRQIQARHRATRGATAILELQQEPPITLEAEAEGQVQLARVLPR